MPIKHEITKTFEEIEEVTHCMYCGSKLTALEGNNKVCPKLCVLMHFVKVGDKTPEHVKKIFKLPTVTPDMHRDFQQCRNGMIS